ncbi:hypothetical protein PIROE2DRAFT_12757 [Piromyces sp. E2]|nr:hypothetical protein PIROE2DRAFT_12757 [Piromyces sp. E2]|eukprot:OUM61264.1 hypothetical protein PIROE2DRAFT_12757 [Piromyces sp. E2]
MNCYKKRNIVFEEYKENKNKKLNKVSDKATTSEERITQEFFSEEQILEIENNEELNKIKENKSAEVIDLTVEPPTNWQNIWEEWYENHHYEDENDEAVIEWKKKYPTAKDYGLKILKIDLNVQT